MALPRILIIEDEPDLAMGLRHNLEYEGYEVIIARDGEEGALLACQERPDLILLDIMLPRLSGLDLCRQLRGKGINTPIIMLTARGQEIDKVIGLEIGADDYVTKPFSIRELLARIHVQLRRQSRRERKSETYRFGEIELDFTGHRAFRKAKPLDLSAREFAILKYFIEHPGETISRDQLLDEVWGYENFPITRTVDNHIARLRQKIEENPSEPHFIITVHRIGYKFLG
jgi:DNA-binding response OmpR family regulator